MKHGNSWKSLLLSVTFLLLLGTPLLGGGDGTPTLSSVDLSGVEVDMDVLTDTDVYIGQSVDFKVTVRNTSDHWSRYWLWFTVKLEHQIHEKMVSTPYLNREAPFAGAIPPYGEAILELSARPLYEIQVGWYTMVAKVGPYVIPFDRVWVSTMDSFHGNILVGMETGQLPGSQGGATQGNGWVITSIRAVNENARSFLEDAVGDSPKAIQMLQNYPNPFNPSTSITYNVKPVDGFYVPVKLAVYDIRGRLVRTLVDDRKSAGIYAMSWDGRDNRGIPVKSGIYIFRMQSGNEVSFRKGVLVK